MKKHQKLRTIIFCIILILTAAVLIAFPKRAAEGAYNGIVNCLEIIIPSLFPFMVLSVFLTQSGLFENVFYIPSRLISRLIGINQKYCSLFLLSMIGGYHSAAKSACLLYKKGEISAENALYLLCFATNAGPAFLISAVGSGMFLSTSLGVILYLSGLLSSFTLMVFYSSKIKENKINLKYKSKEKISVCFVKSVKESCTTMSAMCAFIILFSVFITLLPNFSEKHFSLQTIIYGFAEVTAGCSAAAREISLISVLSAAATCGWGGLCVIFQIYAIFSEVKIKMGRFVYSRLLHSAFSALYTFLLVLVIPIRTEQTFINNSSDAIASFISAPLPALFLLICCVCFPVYLTHQKKL